MSRSAKGIAKRAAHPLLAALGRRLDELAVRLERHTSGLAADQNHRFDAIEERLDRGLRVVDEQMLVAARASRHAGDPPGSMLAQLGPDLVLLVPPGAPLDAVPQGYRVAEAAALSRTPGGGWSVVAGGGPEDLRIALLTPGP